MESYYSSDEEVCWGPVTPREIKKSLNRPRKAVPRRRTIRMNSPPKPEQKHNENILYLTEHLSSLSVQSKYFTPNETMQNFPKTDFEEKASHILNNTEPDSTFITAVDTTNDHSSITVSPESKKVADGEHPKPTDITCIGDNVKDSCLINNFQITLANSYLSDDDDFSNNIDNIIETLSNDLKNSDISHTKPKDIDNKTLLDDSIIVISDGEDEVNNDTSCVINESMRYQGTQSQYEDISEVFEDNLSINQECDNEVTEVEIGQTLQEDLYETGSMNESISSQLSLNDTLEEINRALQMGLDYSMSESQNSASQTEEISKENYIHKTSISKTPKNDENNQSMNYMTDSEFINSRRKNILSNISSSNVNTDNDDVENVEPQHFKPSSHNKKHDMISPSRYYTKSLQSNKEEISEFKPPLRPIKSPMPKFQQNSLSFKNIKSPVAVYIKNCPSAPLQQNIQTSLKPSRLPIKSHIKPQPNSKTNIALPNVFYKPAHNAILSKQREMKLPGSIEKFIPMKSTIIKHEGRIVKSNTKENVNRKLIMESDLTINSSDSSILSASTQDVSILTSKKAMIE